MRLPDGCVDFSGSLTTNVEGLLNDGDDAAWVTYRQGENLLAKSDGAGGAKKIGDEGRGGGQTIDGMNQETGRRH